MLQIMCITFIILITIVSNLLFHSKHMTQIPTYDLPQSPILIIGFFGIFTALAVLYVANKDYFGSPLNEDKRNV